MPQVELAERENSALMSEEKQLEADSLARAQRIKRFEQDVRTMENRQAAQRLRINKVIMELEASIEELKKKKKAAAAATR